MNEPIKKVFYNHVGPIHTYMKALTSNPPEGYTFILPPPQLQESSVQKMAKNKLLKWIYKKILKNSANVFPLLMKSHHLDTPPEASLIISTGPIIEEQLPWILMLLDSPFSIGGNDYYVFKKNLERITKALRSPFCKRIIVHTTHSMAIMKRFFPEDILTKTILVRPAIPLTLPLKKKKPSKTVQFLFLGSINNPGEFLMKGGIEALKTVQLLAQRGDPVELTVRCKVPEKIKKEYSFPYIRYIESFIPSEELAALYDRTDILLMPGYGGYMIMAYFEAFSRGIPIAALDAFGVSDFIQPGINGFIVQPSTEAPTSVEAYPANVRSPSFEKTIRAGDPIVTERLANELEKVIWDRKKLAIMQKNAYDLFKETCSFEVQNKNLKTIFDEATHEA